MSKYRLVGKKYFTGKTVSIFFKKSKHKHIKFPFRKFMREATWRKELSSF